MNICIIPARGGSKRIPRKNIKNFCGKPIIAYSIETAINSKIFNHIIVSTDCKKIAKVAKEYGAEIPFLRPSNISDDYTTTLDVIAHAINWFHKNISNDISQVCTLYATAPFVTSSQLNEASTFLNNEVKYVFSATEFSYNIFRSFKITNNGRCEMLWPENFEKRSQDLEKVYHDAGMFYFGTPDAFIHKYPIFNEYSIPYLIPHYLVQDIDTFDDWNRAEKMYNIINS